LATTPCQPVVREATGFDRTQLAGAAPSHTSSRDGSDDVREIAILVYDSAPPWVDGASGDARLCAVVRGGELVDGAGMSLVPARADGAVDCAWDGFVSEKLGGSWADDDDAEDTERDEAAAALDMLRREKPQRPLTVACWAIPDGPARARLAQQLAACLEAHEEFERRTAATVSTAFMYEHCVVVDHWASAAEREWQLAPTHAQRVRLRADIFRACIDGADWENATECGMALADAFAHVYPQPHPLCGVHAAAVAKLLLFSMDGRALGYIRQAWSAPRWLCAHVPGPHTARQSSLAAWILGVSAGGAPLKSPKRLRGCPLI
jgi:hypothetical protein